jgi:hypothetical protein
MPRRSGFFADFGRGLRDAKPVGGQFLAGYTHRYLSQKQPAARKSAQRSCSVRFPPGVSLVAAGRTSTGIWLSFS